MTKSHVKLAHRPQTGNLCEETTQARVDERIIAAVDAVHGIASPAELYAANGLQHLSFNTLFQFAAEKNLNEADSFLLVPNLLGYWLTGRTVAERTNASTTGLLSITTGQWDDALISRLGYKRSLFPELVGPGTSLGLLLPDIAAQVGASIPVTTVGSHDTASAVVAVPATSEDFAYISCGTWGLVGVELERPVLVGPVEATAIGNVLVQARAQSFVTGSLESLRALVARAFSPKRYLPRG